MANVRTGVTWSAWAETDPGKLRENNEDRVYCDPERGIFLVVDGMGGEAAGEEAAQTALDWIVRRLKQETGTVARRVREAITAANNEVYRLSQANAEWRGMACVLTLAVIEDGTLHIGHVGDTRLYVARNHALRKVTPDHSPVGRREDAGEVTELEAMRHPRRNEVFRDIGSQPHKPDDPDFIEYIQARFEPDSALVLCSDGLSDMLTSAEILKTVELNPGDPREGVRDLIRRANAAGGKDNVSVIIVAGEGFAGGRTPAGAARAVTPPDEPPVIRVRRRAAWKFVLVGMAVGALLAFLFHEWQGRLRPQGQPEDTPLQGAVAPRILSVDPAGAEYATILDALDQARPGDRIVVAPGEYRGPLRLKEGVSVMARSPGEVVVRVAHPLALDDAAVIADGVKLSELSGIVIRAGPESAFPIGVRVVNSDVRMTNVEVTGAAGAGVWIGGNSRAALTGSYIYNNSGAGIVVTGTARPRLVGNIIQGNGFRAGRPGPGIAITENAEPAVLRNMISGNAAEGIRVPLDHMKERMMGNYFGAGAKPNKGGAVAVVKSGAR